MLRIIYAVLLILAAMGVSAAIAILAADAARWLKKWFVD